MISSAYAKVKLVQDAGVSSDIGEGALRVDTINGKHAEFKIDTDEKGKQ